MVLPDFIGMGKKLKNFAAINAQEDDYATFIQDPRRHPKFHLRFIRATNYGKNEITTEWRRLQRIYEDEGPSALLLDFKENGAFPIINDVTASLDLPFDGKKTGPAYLNAQNHVVGYPILGFFATKIQDNLPAGIVKGKLTPAGLKPLLEHSDITPPWKSKH